VNETKQKVHAMIRLNAGNDRNGNPRRVYVGLGADSEIVLVWDEGYQGHHAVPEQLRAMASNAPTFDTSPREYKTLLSTLGAYEARS